MFRSEAPWFGTQRPSMQKNPMIVETTTLGKNRPTLQSPAKSKRMYHGKRSAPNEGVASSMHWQSHTSLIRRDPRCEKDFLSMNRQAVSRGVVRANEQQQFRKNPAGVDTTKFGRSTRSRPQTAPYSSDTTFGVSNRKDDTSMSMLMGAQYQREYLEDKSRSLQQTIDRERSKSAAGRMQQTRSTFLRQKLPEDEPKKMWKMKKFERVPAALNTFRSSQVKQERMEQYRRDRVNRKGTEFGHGIYNAGGTHPCGTC